MRAALLGLVLTGVASPASSGASTDASKGLFGTGQVLLLAGTGAPETTIDSGPTGLINDASPSFSFSSSEPDSSFECRLDSTDEADWQACDSPTSYGPLADGPHSFEVRATDGAQNTDPTPAARQLTVDTVGPAVPQITDTDPDSPANDNDPEVKGMLGAGDPTAVTLYENANCHGVPEAIGTADELTGAGIAVSVPGDATATLSAQAADGVGNDSGCSDSFDYREDSTAPETTIDSGPSGTSSDPSPSFGFSSSEPDSSFECKVDSGAYAPCTSPKTTSLLTDGAHAFFARATDRAGNVDPTAASRSFMVDGPPDTTISGGPSGPTNNRTPAFTFTSSDAGSTFTCRIDTGAYAPCTSPKTTSLLTDGARTFYVKARDPAGNIDPSPASRSFAVDTAPPNTTISGGPSGPTNNPTPTFTLSSSDAGSTFACKVDSKPYAACTSPKGLSQLADGSHTISVRATDPAGNPDATPASRSFTVRTAPNVLVIETDDQTAESMRIMNNVNSLIGAQGATFQNSVVNFSLCCPSRATFLTGQYAHNHGVVANTAPNGGFYRFESLHGQNNLAVWLQKAGYYTGMVGKYLNEYANQPLVPPGWSEWHAAAPDWTDSYDYTLNDNGTSVHYGQAPADYKTDVETSKALDFVNRRAPKPQPFFLWLTYMAPHIGGPYLDPNPPSDCSQGVKPAPRHAHAFDSEPLPITPNFNESDVSDKSAAIRNLPVLGDAEIADIQRKYRCALESLLSVDEGVKNIVDALSAKGELNNTLLIFTSDNGYFNGEHRVPAHKQKVYEESIRVPLEMRGPGIPQGVNVGDLAINADLAPTIMQVATAASPGLVMDGRSLIPVAQHPGIESGRELLIEQPGLKAIRTQRYMYVEYTTGEQELYDLQNDPFELQSLHADPAYASVKVKLATELLKLKTCAGAGCRLHSTP